ncbi:MULTISPECIES: hypothetical protein [Cysteiniphilum]|uniref:Uncharacterized protein n=1 Tax=Cysteiniphilum litorale TaxID=2056700 RepID=A0A8J2Z5U6_9GAMM|nr:MULTISPECIES: hypothetical protein [Cysteiniphilum]GGG03213.1 hypothetical protein GCM10010995_20830 [Cysteiniphilum litorale]
MKTTNAMLKYRTKRLIDIDREEIEAAENVKSAHKSPVSDFFIKYVVRQPKDGVRSLAPYLRRNAGL